MLFWKEMKKVVCSIPYLLFVAAIAIGLYSQGVFHFQDDLVAEPQPGGNYGVKQEEIPETIMPAALQDLWAEFCGNDYVTYPIGFIKHVRLDGKEKAKMAEILSEVTGMAQNAILRAGDSAAMQSPTIRSDMGYARFQELMGQADGLLGGGSKYAAESLNSYGSVPLTYEEAKERYSAAVNDDHITGGYARLFSDYAVVMLMSILPVFLAAILCLKDQRSKMDSLIYTKKISAARIILLRYLALLAAAMLPIFILSYMSNIPIWGAYNGIKLDYLAPLKYGLGWILPTVMAAAAVGMFLTELTSTPIAIAFQGFWWLFDTNAGIRSAHAGYALSRLSPRHNAGARSWFETQAYLDNFQSLLKNRLLFAAISLLLVALTVLIYESKRKGKFHGSLPIKKMLSNTRDRKSQPKA